MPSPVGDPLLYLPGRFPSEAHSRAQPELTGTLRMGLAGMEVGDTNAGRAGGFLSPVGPAVATLQAPPREGGKPTLSKSLPYQASARSPPANSGWMLAPG